MTVRGFLCLLLFGFFYNDVMAIPCQVTGIKFQKDQLTLNNNHEGQRLYLFKNKAQEPITLDYQNISGIAHAGFSSLLTPGRWSAASIIQPHFTVICYQGRKDDHHAISCQEVLKVCAVPGARFPGHLRHSWFWIEENEPLQTLLVKIKKRGISFP